MFVFSPLSKRLQHHEVLSILLAAAIHDFDHPGYTNNFLVNTGHQLAILYNDRSVLENHHVASAWKLMISNPKFEFLSGLDPLLLNKIRIATIELVLSTDLAKHSQIISCWTALFEKEFDVEDQHSRLIMMQMIIKCSDISNPAKEYKAHSRWSRLVIQEFYLQGDLERYVQSHIVGTGGPRFDSCSSTTFFELIFILIFTMTIWKTQDYGT